MPEGKLQDTGSAFGAPKLKVSEPKPFHGIERRHNPATVRVEPDAGEVSVFHELTITDDCTTLYNARHLNFMLDTEIYRSHRYSYEFSIIFIDLDHFKSVNDTHGHLTGSKLLGEIGTM
ncbi:MAG: diguanylate cyclase, partial [Candidatus Acidiferrales bacterium]